MTFLSPSLTVFLENEWIHLGLLSVLIPLAIYSFVSSRRIHGENLPLIIGNIGVGFLVLAILLEDFKAMDFESIFTVCGSVTLITAHVMNMRFKN